MKPITRRTFLKQMGTTSAVMVASNLFSELVFSAFKASQVLSKDFTWHRSPCRFCGVGCSLLLGVQNGRVTAVRGDPHSPVNRGLCCVKGYHSILSLYGKDRLTRAKIRKTAGWVEVPISEALDLVAAKISESIQHHGKDSVALYGSGQWTIPDGYVASKLWKGAIGSNNLEANARLCMASAVSGFLTTFGMDEPMGCYDDIDHADAFILWGNNMAEMHPVLFSRMLDRRLRNKKIKIIDLTTRTTRTSYGADRSIIFNPQTDLALANAICYELIASGGVKRDFVEQYCAFKKGETHLGYGLTDDFTFSDVMKDSSWDEFQTFLNDYSPEKVTKLTGVSVQDIRFLASLYGDPRRKVMSLWCMGVNQHTRGTWMNNLIYNLHLLTGKIASPGNSPFSLTGQPSACGTVREVGTLTNRLPHGVVTNEEDRKLAAKIWNVPVEKIPAKPTHDTMSMFRALDRGEIKFMWIQCTNPMVTLPNLKRYRDGAQKAGRFIVVSDVYPTPTTDIADVILPSALWVERAGMFGNSERRTQYFDKVVDPPGEAMSDTWQLIEVARRLGFQSLFPWKPETHIEEIWNEYRQFHEGAAHELAPLAELKEKPGVMWPRVKGVSTQWRYNTHYDPAALGFDPKSSRDRFDFYGNPDHRARIWLRPYEPPPEIPDKEYPFWLDTGRVLEHWHTGSLTRRIPILHQAMPHGYVELHPEDAKKLNVHAGDRVRLTTRRGSLVLPASVEDRGRPAPGHVFVPFFDETLPINELTLDAFCPISGQPDYKKCAVRVEKT